MGDNECVVRLRGLPWSAKPEEIIKFLEGCVVVGEEEGVHIILGADGRSSGEAYVELASEDDVKLALSKNKSHIGRRYIDVFKAKHAEMDWALKRSGPHDFMVEMEALVRLRGLPYGCSKEEIANFFSGLEIVPNGITIITDHYGRTTGDAFVQFASLELVNQALQKHKETIGHRYIEVFKSSFDELMTVLCRLNNQQPAMGFGRPRPFRGPPDRFGIGMSAGLGPAAGDFMRYGGGGGGNGGRVGPGFYNNGFGNFPGNYGGGDCGPAGYGGFGGSGYGGGPGTYSGMSHRGGRGGFNAAPVGRGTGRGKRPFIGGIINRGSMYESQTGHSIHMRGLPYSATEEDIAQFFVPLSCVNICIQYNKDGRPSGDADVDFASHEEAQEAMKRNKALMQKRYIELFLKSSSSGRSNNFRGHSYGNGCLYGGSNYTAF